MKSPAENMIEAKGLARTFRSRHGVVEAVCGVDFTVRAGEIVGFLGPNGAGKMTTLRMLTTLLMPTAGSATVAGCDLRADPAGVRCRIGYVA
jgi:ABC-2 type transport system ATP-binding protein